MSHSFYINKPVTFLSLFHNSNNIWWQMQLMQLYIMQFSRISYYIQPQKYKYWSAPTLFPNPAYSLPSMSQTKYHTHIYKNTA